MLIFEIVEIKIKPAVEGNSLLCLAEKTISSETLKVAAGTVCQGSLATLYFGYALTAAATLRRILKSRWDFRMVSEDMVFGVLICIIFQYMLYLPR